MLPTLGSDSCDDSTAPRILAFQSNRETDISPCPIWTHKPVMCGAAHAVSARVQNRVGHVVFWLPISPYMKLVSLAPLYLAGVRAVGRADGHIAG